MKFRINFRFLSIIIFFISTTFYILYGYNYARVYKSISNKSIDTAVLEYGSSKSIVTDLYNNLDGKVISVEKGINTKKLGLQTAVLKIEKDNIETSFELDVEVVDTISPEIKFKRDVVEINQGEEINLNDNIESVFDVVDGKIDYLMENSTLKMNYYTIISSVNFDVAGSYAVNVNAVDKNGNNSSSYYTVVVRDNERFQKLADIAYSLVGKPYVYGGVGPNGFDCSGLVQYIYKQIGISVSRSASTQINDGKAISYEDIMPGDIISWGYINGVVTHSAIYVGNGKMVHAANANQGVIVSDVEAWQRGSDVIILGIRRV